MSKLQENLGESAKEMIEETRQKACYIVDALVDALGYHSSSSLRRAIILVDIDQYPGTTQAEIMERVDISKSSLSREIDWLFNYGCIQRQESESDGRAVRLEVCGYSNKALEDALSYFKGGHEDLKKFLRGLSRILGDKKSNLREAKIITTLHKKGQASKQEIVENLYQGSASTENRAILGLIEEGLIEDAA